MCSHYSFSRKIFAHISKEAAILITLYFTFTQNKTLSMVLQRFLIKFCQFKTLSTVIATTARQVRRTCFLSYSTSFLEAGKKYLRQQKKNSFSWHPFLNPRLEFGLQAVRQGLCRAQRGNGKCWVDVHCLVFAGSTFVGTEGNNIEEWPSISIDLTKLLTYYRN